MPSRERTVGAGVDAEGCWRRPGERCAWLRGSRHWELGREWMDITKGSSGGFRDRAMEGRGGGESATMPRLRTGQELGEDWRRSRQRVVASSSMSWCRGQSGSSLKSCIPFSALPTSSLGPEIIKVSRHPHATKPRHTLSQLRRFRPTLCLRFTNEDLP